MNITKLSISPTKSVGWTSLLSACVSGVKFLKDKHGIRKKLYCRGC